MQYRNLIILTLFTVTLFNCRRYQTFDEMAINNQTSSRTHPQQQDSGLQSILSQVDGDNSAYWIMNDQQAYIYPNAWQDENVSHALQFNQERAIIHAPFEYITIDEIQFDQTNAWPEILLKTYNSPTNTSHLEIYQLINNHPSILFNLSTHGEIEYISHPEDPALSTIVVTTITSNRIEKDFYQYQYDSKRFRLIHSESESDTDASRRSSMEEFLRGPWIGDDAPEEQAMVLFNPDEKTIIFQHERVEIYEWKNTVVSGSRITISAQNQQVPQVSGASTVTILDNNTITLSSTAGSAWPGSYKRLNIQQEQVNMQGAKPLAWQQSPFSGSYVNQNSDEFIFDYPQFIKKSANGSSREGSMALFSLNNKDIMQLRYRNNYGIIDEQESYELTFKEENDGLHYLRLLQLKPTRLFIFGSYPLPQSVINQFEQIERIK